MKNNSLIELTQVTKYYELGGARVCALNIPFLKIEKGEYVAILGPSGSGKSTLMNILGCLDTPTSGKYFLNNNDVCKMSRNELAKIRNKEIGFIFQSFNLLDYATALENVALPLVYANVSVSERKEKAKALLKQVGLQDRLGHRPKELSGGQSQRVAIARALANEPNLILADEPTGNLDTQSGEQVMKLFESCVDNGKTILIVTHDLNLAKRAKRIIRIRDGAVVGN
jgi:putative ABC transport system ATP-binding protein